MIRLTGTNEAEAFQILKGIGMTALSDMDEAVQQVVELPRRGPHEHLRRQGDPPGGAGHHRPRGLVPREADAGVRHRRSSAGVTPGKGGQMFEGKVPVFNTVAEAVARDRRQHLGHLRAADGAPRARIFEAADAGIRLIVCITEGIPVHAHDPGDALRPRAAACGSSARTVPGSSRPGEAKVGIIPGNICTPGRVGMVSPERHAHLRGREPPHQGRDRPEHLRRHRRRPDHRHQLHRRACAAFQDDPGTDAIVMMGEIGGTDEQKAAAFVKAHVTKPVVGFIAGQTAPKGRRMGHAGAIISGSSGTAEEKMAAFEAAGHRASWSGRWMWSSCSPGKRLV